MWVKVYDEKYRLNMRNGKNFDKVMLKITPLIRKIAWRYRKSFFMPLEALQQEIYVIALEGMNTYDPKKGTKLSTFITTHIENKIISKLEHQYTQKRSSSFRNPEKREDGTIYACRPIFSSNLVNGAPASSSLYIQRNDFKAVEFRLSLNSLMRRYSKSVGKDALECIEGIYFNDRQINECRIVKEKRLSPWAISVRLKSLSKFLNNLKLERGREGDVPSKSHLNKVFFIQ